MWRYNSIYSGDAIGNDEMNKNEERWLCHYGVPRRSGRYPYGSGKEHRQSANAKSNKNETTTKTKNVSGFEALVPPALAVATLTLATVKLARDIHMNTPTDYLKKEHKVESLSELTKKNRYYTTEEDLLLVNKRKTPNEPGTTSNCASCAMTMEMRARGYDVAARRKSRGLTEPEMLSYYKNVKFTNPVTAEYLPTDKRKDRLPKAYDSLINNLSANGENSRGIIIGYFEYDYCDGHAMYWSVKNGKAKIYDPQNPTDDPEKSFKMYRTTGWRYFRTDNTEPSDNIGELMMSRKFKK